MFRLHAIGSDVLPQLTAEDLLEVGVESLGHRLRILKLIDGAVGGGRRPRLVYHPGGSSASVQTLGTASASPPGQSPRAPLSPGALRSPGGPRSLVSPLSHGAPPSATSLAASPPHPAPQSAPSPTSRSPGSHPLSSIRPPSHVSVAHASHAFYGQAKEYTQTKDSSGKDYLGSHSSKESLAKDYLGSHLSKESLGKDYLGDYSGNHPGNHPGQDQLGKDQLGNSSGKDHLGKDHLGNSSGKDHLGRDHLGKDSSQANDHSPKHPSPKESPANAAIVRENALLKQRLESNERQIKRLNDTVAKLRSDLFRRFKEAEPLPNPHERPAKSPVTASGPATPGSASPAPTTPGSHMMPLPSLPGHAAARPHLAQQSSSLSVAGMKRADSLKSDAAKRADAAKRSSVYDRGPADRSSPPDGYFARGVGSAPNSASGASAYTLPIVGSLVSPGAPPHGSDPAPSSNVMIHNSGVLHNGEPFKKFRCAETDDAARVLASMFRRYRLDGELSQWRLQIVYGDKSRDLLDHEFPLVIFKQLQEQGRKPMFHAKKIQPSKPPTGSYI